MIKIIILLFILACAGPFFIKDKNGKPFTSPGQIKQQVKQQVYDKFYDIKLFFFKPKIPPKAETENIGSYIPYKNRDYTEMYKYRDKKGILHFSDQKPQHIKHEVMYIPVSSNEDINNKKQGSLLNKLFKKKNHKQKSSSDLKTDSKTDSKTDTQSPGEFISQAKKMFKTVAEQYQKAPEALGDAKDLKKQVEEVYQKREKIMEDTQ